MNLDRILITGRLYNDLELALAGKVNKAFRFLSENEVSQVDLEWAEAFVSFRPTPIFSFANLKWVHSLGAGVDSFLFKKEWKKEVILTRTIGSFGRKISEYCLSYILRDLQLHDRFEESKKKKTWYQMEPQTLGSQNVVVFGTGSIGQEVARNLSSLGAHVKGVSMSGNNKEHFSQVVDTSQLNNVLRDADWLINTLPLTPATENLFTKQLFCLLHNAGFINVGRGASVDDEALLEALNCGSLRIAVLDAFRDEPLSQSSLLWNHDDIIITPHVSAITSLDVAVNCLLDTLTSLETGEQLNNIVNLDKGF